MRKATIYILVALLAVNLAVAATTTIRPDGAGYRKAWGNTGCSSGSNEWQCVDEVTTDTSDYLQTSGTKKETFTFSSTGLTSETINSVTMYYHAQQHNNNKNRCFEAMTRSGGTDYLSGSQLCVGSSWSTVNHAYSTNPATGSAWTVSEVEALEAGMHGLNPDGGGRVAQVWAVVDYQVVDSCADTDGFDITIQGSVSGNSGGSPYSFTDSCVTGTVVQEWYCSGTSAQSFNQNCTGNFTSCSAGACV